MQTTTRKLASALIAMIMAAGLACPAYADGASTLIARGDQQWSQGHLDLALKFYQKAVRTDTDSTEAHLRLAGLHLARQDFDAGVKEFKRAIAIDPKNARAWIGLAIASLHGGNTNLARAALHEAIRLEPGRKAQLDPVLAKLDNP
jgi:Flp pilus assembly protein TadD